jgi:hypothetical protein
MISGNVTYTWAALVPGALFGLVTFSHKIGLYDVQGPVPLVKNVFIPSDFESSLSLPLQDVMPLLSFLAPVNLQIVELFFEVVFNDITCQEFLCSMN